MGHVLMTGKPKEKRTFKLLMQQDRRYLLIDQQGVMLDPQGARELAKDLEEWAGATERIDNLEKKYERGQ